MEVVELIREVGPIAFATACLTLVFGILAMSFDNDLLVILAAMSGVATAFLAWILLIPLLPLILLIEGIRRNDPVLIRAALGVTSIFLGLWSAAEKQSFGLLIFFFAFGFWNLIKASNQS